MRRSLLSLLIVAAASCAWPAGRSAEGAIRDATQRYARLSMAMDHAAIAAMFAPEGDLVVSPSQSVRGPAAIQRYLEGFRDFHVLSDTLTTDRVDVTGTTAHSEGTYAQRVTLPAGQTVDAHGRYAIDWVKDAGGAWLIQRMSTAPAP